MCLAQQTRDHGISQESHGSLQPKPLLESSSFINGIFSKWRRNWHHGIGSLASDVLIVKVHKKVFKMKAC